MNDNTEINDEAMLHIIGNIQKSYNRLEYTNSSTDTSTTKDKEY